MYIQGLGIIDDNYLNASITNAIPNNNTNAVVPTSMFDKILAEHTATYTTNDKKYTLDEIFTEASEKYNIPKKMLEAVGYVESHFNPEATSSVGAMGIMQLMPNTAKSLGVEDAYDPYQNIMGAAKFLNKLSEMYNGDQNLMLAAYNAGSGNVAKYNGIPPFKGVQEYVAKVLDAMKNGVNVPNDKTYAADSSKSAAEVYQSMLGGFNSSDLDKVLSRSDYDLLMNFYTNMLEIISSIGNTDEENESDSALDNSLADLYKLGVQQNLRKL